MRYRILINKSKDDTKYLPQVKKWYGWVYLYYGGDEITWWNRYKIRPYVYVRGEYDTPNDCLTAIERHASVVVRWGGEMYANRYRDAYRTMNEVIDNIKGSE